MGQNRWPIKYINTLWENKTGEQGKKAAKCYLQGKATYSPPLGRKHNSYTQICICSTDFLSAYM